MDLSFGPRSSTVVYLLILIQLHTCSSWTPSPSFQTSKGSFRQLLSLRRIDDDDVPSEGDYGYYHDSPPSPRQERSAVDPYWDEENQREKTYQDLGGYGGVYDDAGVQESFAEDIIEWEKCTTDAGTVQVLLPPPSVDLPTTIIHFVGGTFFGSAPRLWYKQLLEDIVKHTQAAVIASSIPVTLLQSPLQHISLSRQIQRQFQTAWREVLLDEYGQDVQKLPVCGLGHSLGSRLLVVLATLGATTSPDRPFQPPPYKSYMLISFTNYGAAAGIPGIYQLNKASRRVERQKTEESGKRPTKRRRRRDDWMDEDEDDNDDWDEEWGEIFGDIQDGLKEQVGRVQTALTPRSKDLEFYPSPEQLWKALTEGKRYTVSETLIIQFDDDEVDQSAKLAKALLESSSVKFARLRGTHLTPVSAQNTDRNKAWLQQINSRAGRMLWKVLTGRRQLRSNEESLRDLRQSIARYITEIVTK